MPNDKMKPEETNRILVKLRPSSASALRAAESRARLRPLHEGTEPQASAFGLDAATPRWFLAELSDGAATPWDLAHARVADQLGVSESDVLFAEPDIVHAVFKDGEPVRGFFQDTNEEELTPGLAAADKCEANPQDGGHGKKTGDGDFWHLGDAYSQLDSARRAVSFTEPRTRIGHLDTGYYRAHACAPEHVARELERSFVEGEEGRQSAEDPDNNVFLIDNSGHGTGTIGILAGQAQTPGGTRVGGAPHAEVLPLRVADRVVLLRTSALAQAIRYATDQRCDVITLSMGGVPMRSWAEEVDRAYEAGVCICAAAGNHVGITPPRTLVYPARYPRVVAVCGVMADGSPYADLKGLGTLEGSFGPDSVMKYAVAAYTPNIPWPRFMCGNVIRHNGEGTSAATPQVAASVALWLEHHKQLLPPRDWRRVEAARNALFTTTKLRGDKTHFGNGVMQALKMLDVKPALGLPKSAPSENSIPILRLVTGLGIAQIPPREEMFNQELAQRWLLNERLQRLVPDPSAAAKIPADKLRKVMEAIIEDEGASLALRKHVATRYPVAAGRAAPRRGAAKQVIPEVLSACDDAPALRNPPYRRVRVYAVDPSLSTRFDTAGINEVALKVRWENLEGKGPLGEYLAVEDVDASGKPYAPVNLDDPRLLAQDGWAPSEGNPQFHQQMVYAVAMKTIEHFEGALGRPVLWRPRPNPRNANDDRGFIRQLSVRPHALRQANAFYSQQQVALLFGYFEAAADDPGDHVPGSRVYSCLSHDIIAHETTHAILDGMHRRFSEPTNPDVLALHEGFADIVALMQHFTMPEVLQQEIAKTRGDIESESMLGQLAVQFGRATGGRGALRSAIGTLENGVWTRRKPDPTELQKRLTPHSRGAVLVAAVFDAFIAIYNSRIADLLRIYTGGTGVLPTGAIHPDLVGRLTDEAAKAAGHVLQMCVRALDYLPPVDVTFFEYLRALITADFDMVSDDRHNYRVAFVEAFRRRGIYPLNLDDPTADTLRTLSVDTLRWQGLDPAEFPRGVREKIKQQYRVIIAGLKDYADECLYIDRRETLFEVTRARRLTLHKQLEKAFAAVPEFALHLGLDPSLTFEVHALRRAMRTSPDGRNVPQLIVALTQSRKVGGRGAAAGEQVTPAHVFRGGSTLVVDLSVPEVKYRIVKNINSGKRQERTATFAREAAADPLRALFLAPDRHGEPFAALHALADDGF